MAGPFLDGIKLVRRERVFSFTVTPLPTVFLALRPKPPVVAA